MSGEVPEAGGRVTWSTLLAQTADRFRWVGLEAPEMDARRIVEEITGVEAGALHSVLDTPATERGVARLDSMMARREAGEPLQYVLGRWGFRQLDLMVDQRVLVPRPETEMVAGLAIDEVIARSGAADEDVIVVDLGTGSGAIGLSVAVECSRARVLATDLSPEALAVARANLAGIGRSAARVTLHEGSWFQALPDSALGCVDVLVSNPPYIADGESLPPVVADWEPAGALRAGSRGDEDLLRIVKEADLWLAPGAAVVLEMAPNQTESVALHWRELGYRAVVHDDLAGRARAVVARKPT